MDRDTSEIVDLETLVADDLSGKSGFANTKKLRKLGLDGYKTWLRGYLAEKMVRKNDPRKRKRAARKAKKQPD